MGRNNKHLKIRAIITFLLFLLSTTLVYSQCVDLSNKKSINLLLVHSFDNGLPDYPRFNKLLEEHLSGAKLPVRTTIFYLDCDAYDKEDEEARIYSCLDTISAKPDIILVCDDQATYSLLACGHPLLKKVPIVFSGVNFPNWDLLKQYPNVTGIWDNPNYRENIQMIEELMGIKRIRFFYDKTYNGKRVIERLAEQYENEDQELCRSLNHFLQYKDSIKNELQVTNGYLKGSDYNERPAKTSLHFINMRDDLGQNLLWNISGTFKYSVFLLTKYDYTIVQVGRFATVPTFSAVNKGFMCNRDILGGYFTTMEEQIAETSDYIIRLTNGQDVSQLPIKESLKKCVVDWLVLNRWDIPVSKVPKHIEILNMPFYVKYQTEVILCFSLLFVFIIIIIGCLIFLYRREAKRKHKAQLDLWEEKEFLSLALGGGNIFGWRYNRERNEFTIEKEFFDSIGLPYRKISWEEMTQMTHPDDLNQSESIFLNVLNQVEKRSDLRTRINFYGTGYIWYEFRFLNVSGILEDCSSVIGLLMNIQEYKSKEEELTTAKDLALKAELKQSFLANMSHEIRTPLNAIVGFSNILVNDDELPDDEKLEYIHIINSNCELLLKLINDILEISRIESGNMSFEFRPCSLNSLVEDVYKSCLLQVPAAVEFIECTLSEDMIIETDVMRLRQVLMNFVSNAFKFTVSGHVAIGVEHNDVRKEVCFYVEDTGEGIPEAEQKMIFDRFYKINEFTQGTGLGLSICQVIATKLKGRITLSSEMNKGSRFNIVLSYADQAGADHLHPDNALTVAEKVSSVNSNLPIVLIAEDSVNNYMVLNNILKKFCTVVWAINGKDALDIVNKQKVDVVLMDIKMYEMDGLTALRKIRKKHKKLPVVIQTAYAFDENRKQAEEAGANGFIAKPIRVEELMGVIGKYIGN